MIGRADRDAAVIRDDPKAIIDEGPMSGRQWIAVFVTVGLNALDGFDVLSISFASPGIAKEWSIGKDVLGWVLSMELVGMAFGSVTLGGVADKIGRRPTILGCLLAMTIGMAGAAHAGDVPTLLAYRLITGLGIGGVLASINAAAAEYSSRRWRSAAMALMVIGYPIGGVIGGLLVQRLLVIGTWRDIFICGAWATAAFLPIVWFFAPEPVAFLDRRQRSGALEKINRVLTRFGHAPADALSTQSQDSVQRSLADIFKPGLVGTTLLVTLAYFAHMMSFYFLLKWIPKIAVDWGFAPKQAAALLTWLSVGGAVGGALFGLIATRTQLARLTIVTLVAGSIAVVWFGRGSTTANHSAVAASVALAGFFTNSSIVGFYSLFAKVFPTHVRATGTGFAIGIGRGGASLGPVVAGYLFLGGFAVQTVALIMAMGSLVALVALLAIKEREAD